AIVEDNNKNLWVSSTSGIYRIINDKNETSRFSKGFGVNAGSMFFLSAFKAYDGQLIFGNTQGYYSIYPDKISSNAKPPEICLTEFRITDPPVKPGAGGPLKEDLLRAKQIVLGFNQDVFSIFFNVIHYSNPDANRAMYKLENYDKGWRPAGSER